MFVFGNKNITTAMIAVGGAFQAQVFYSNDSDIALSILSGIIYLTTTWQSSIHKV